MKNFLVVVDDKFLVSVSANSAGGAEHRILDNCEARFAQAFSFAELKHMYDNYGDERVTVSVEELAKRLMLKQADELEKQARELLDKAKAIRKECA